MVAVSDVPERVRDRLGRRGSVQKVQLVVTELAPEACIVCGKAKPSTPPEPNTWIYLAGATPLGSMACCPECAHVAVERFLKTGRCDAEGEKS